MVSFVGHTRASTLNSVSAAFDLKGSHTHLRKPSKDTSKGPFYNLLCSCLSAFHTPSYRDDGKHPHNTKNTGFHLGNALCRQGSTESRHLWLTHQLWNLFQNLLIFWQEWAIASQKMQSSEPLPDSQTQVKPNCLHWGWAVTLLFWLLQSQRCLVLHPSKLNEWWIKVSQTWTHQGKAAGDRFLI